MAEYKRKDYYDNGSLLTWADDLTESQLSAMESGEIFTLCDPEGKPYSFVLKDSYGTIRETQRKEVPAL